MGFAKKLPQFVDPNFSLPAKISNTNIFFFLPNVGPQILALTNQIWPNNHNPPLLRSGETLELGYEEDET
jgi:hypothetical protein